MHASVHRGTTPIIERTRRLAMLECDSLEVLAGESGVNDTWDTARPDVVGLWACERLRLLRYQAIKVLVAMKERKISSTIGDLLSSFLFIYEFLLPQEDVGNYVVAKYILISVNEKIGDPVYAISRGCVISEDCVESSSISCLIECEHDSSERESSIASSFGLVYRSPKRLICDDRRTVPKFSSVPVVRLLTSRVDTPFENCLTSNIRKGTSPTGVIGLKARETLEYVLGKYAKAMPKDHGITTPIQWDSDLTKPRLAPRVPRLS
ncbi:hypothetical protein Scep_025450 [Stephania cephalantha]|uniref:Uncharacterized protein n=1 Tax=Stephania cephalantha TaxID=152367 RepID=A0AAP0EI90_9MAGN